MTFQKKPGEHLWYLRHVDGYVDHAGWGGSGVPGWWGNGGGNGGGNGYRDQEQGPGTWARNQGPGTKGQEPSKSSKTSKKQ